MLSRQILKILSIEMGTVTVQEKKTPGKFWKGFAPFSHYFVVDGQNAIPDEARKNE